MDTPRRILRSMTRYLSRQSLDREIIDDDTIVQNHTDDEVADTSPLIDHDRDSYEYEQMPELRDATADEEIEETDELEDIEGAVGVDPGVVPHLIGGPDSEDEEEEIYEEEWIRVNDDQEIVEDGQYSEVNEARSEVILNENKQVRMTGFEDKPQQRNKLSQPLDVRPKTTSKMMYSSLQNDQTPNEVVEDGQAVLRVRQQQPVIEDKQQQNLPIVGSQILFEHQQLPTTSDRKQRQTTSTNQQPSLDRSRRKQILMTRDNLLTTKLKNLDTNRKSLQDVNPRNKLTKTRQILRPLTENEIKQQQAIEQLNKLQRRPLNDQAQTFGKQNKAYKHNHSRGDETTQVEPDYQYQRQYTNKVMTVKKKPVIKKIEVPKPITPLQSDESDEDVYYQPSQNLSSKIGVYEAMYAPPPQVQQPRKTIIEAKQRQPLIVQDNLPTHNINQVSTTTKAKINIPTPKFDGNGWTGFKIQFLNASRANHWDDEQKLENLIGALTGDATRVLAEEVDDNGVTQPLIWTFETLMNELAEKFNYIGSRYELESRVNSMTQLSREDEFAFADRLEVEARKLPMSAAARTHTIMRIFTNGVSNPELRSFFVNFEPTTLKQAKEIIQKFRIKQRVGPQGRISNPQVSMVADDKNNNHFDDSQIRQLRQENRSLQQKLNRTETELKEIRDQVTRLSMSRSSEEQPRFNASERSGSYFRGNSSRGFRGQFRGRSRPFGRPPSNNYSNYPRYNDDNRNDASYRSQVNNPMQQRSQSSSGRNQQQPQNRGTSAPRRGTSA